MIDSLFEPRYSSLISWMITDGFLRYLAYIPFEFLPRN